MRYVIKSIGFLLVMLSFISTAFADVPIPIVRPPYNPGRWPRPPVVKYYEQRNADLTILKKSKEPVFFLRVTLPGPCTWSYTVNNHATGERFVSETFKNTEKNTETEEKELELSLPPEGRKFTYTVSAKFTLYGFRDTRFGPKIYYGSKEKKKFAARTYEMENINGRFRLREIE